MASIQELNRRRYTQNDIDEGKRYLVTGELPVRLQNNPQQQAAFAKKWHDAIIQDEQIVIGQRTVVAQEDVPGILQQAYHDPLTSGGRDQMFQRLQQHYIGISRRRIMSYLANEESWQLHQPLPKPVVQQAGRIHGSFKHFCFDLIDFSSLANHNANNNWCLTAMDKFSRYAWAFPLPNKSGPVVLTAIAKVLSTTLRLPTVCQFDSGGEFTNIALKNLLTEKGIKIVYSESYKPSSNPVERFNGTLKRKIYKYLTMQNTLRWYDKLPVFLENYNGSVHSSTNISPMDLQQASLDNNEELLANVAKRLEERAIRIFERNRPSNAQQEVNIGDWVRLSAYTLRQERRNASFRKSYKINWSKELYRVKTKSNGGPWYNPQYTVEDDTGRWLAKRYYRPDLQKIDRDSLMTITRPEPAPLSVVPARGPPLPPVLPPTQASERKPGSRLSLPRSRLIDEYLQQLVAKKTSHSFSLPRQTVSRNATQET